MAKQLGQRCPLFRPGHNSRALQVNYGTNISRNPPQELNPLDLDLPQQNYNIRTSTIRPGSSFAMAQSSDTGRININKSTDSHSEFNTLKATSIASRAARPSSGIVHEPMPYSLTAAVSCRPLLAFTDQGRIWVRITKFLDQVSRTKEPAEPEPLNPCVY